MKYLLFFLTVIVLFNTASAQIFFTPKKYPRSFRNPLSTAFQFVGNFGESRPDHFHSGLDIRTDAQENKSVYAVEDGYVSRVKIEAGGFGNAIYITHASGYTSLYAHLNKFYPELENFIRQKQYANKSWNIDMTFFPDQFWVKKGSFIAWSGNTGSSQGPHLHFEIRNAKTEAPLNPLLFFDEIIDNKNPLIKQIAVYDAAKSIYEQSPALYMLNKGMLKKDTIIVNTNKIYLGIQADDYMPMGVGTLGIYEMRLYADEKPLIAWQLDNISYDITRYVNAFTDYKTRKNKGFWLQLCRKLPNNKLSVYKTFDTNNGIIDLSDGQPRNIRIEVYDTRYNTSSVSFTLMGKPGEAPVLCNNEMVAGRKNTFKNDYLSFTLGQDALYDNICFKTSVKSSTRPYSHIYQVHYNFVPLHSYFDLMLSPKKSIPDELRNKIAVVKISGKGTAAKLVNNRVMATIREFGDYEIVTDEKAPVITTKVKNGMNIAKSTALYFNVTEETTSVKSCTATIDGQWLRLVQKGNTFYYEMDDHFPIGTHQLAISATDQNDNITTKTYTLTR